METDRSGNFTSEQVEELGRMAAALYVSFSDLYHAVVNMVNIMDQTSQKIQELEGALEEFFRRELMLKDWVAHGWPRKWAMWIAVRMPVWGLPEHNPERLMLLTVDHARD